MTTRAAFLAACRAELGYHETPVNRTKFAAQAHHPNGEAWCLTFLVAKARQTGLHLPYYGAFTPSMAQAFKAAGHYGLTPRVGAFGFVYHPELGRIAHAFVVETLLPDRFTIGINGNSNNDGSRNGIMVCRVKRSPYHITYGYPTYSSTATAPTATVTTHPNPHPVPVLGSRPYIYRAGHHTAAEVQYIQWAAGGPLYDDGIWGTTTERIVRSFQEHKGLRPDGEVGTRTLTAMRAVRR